MREIVPQSLFHNGLKVHDEGIATNNDERDQCQLHLHVGKAVVFSSHVLVPLGLDDFLGIDTRKAAADGNSCNRQKEEKWSERNPTSRDTFDIRSNPTTTNLVWQ